MNGNLLLCNNRGIIQEVDMMGNVVQEITNEFFGEPRFHHDCIELENGNLVTLSVDMREIGPYPPDGEFYNVVGDIIFEFNWDGDIINEISLHDVIDPFRVIKGFHNDFYNGLFGVDTKDWTHSNSVIRDYRDNSYIVSVRHQDIVIKVSNEGELIWVLGEDHPDTSGDDDWPFLELVGPGTYPNHQHAAEIIPNGDLILYDNANTTHNARPVIYHHDEENLTMTQEFEYYDPEIPDGVCSGAVGDANYLPGDSILITHGAMRIPGTGCPHGIRQIQILEVDRFSGEKLFEIVIKDPTGVNINGYRAERLPTLYPF